MNYVTFGMENTLTLNVIYLRPLHLMSADQVVSLSNPIAQHWVMSFCCRCFVFAFMFLWDNCQTTNFWKLSKPMHEFRYIRFSELIVKRKKLIVFIQENVSLIKIMVCISIKLDCVKPHTRIYVSVCVFVCI